MWSKEDFHPGDMVYVMSSGYKRLVAAMVLKQTKQMIRTTYGVSYPGTMQFIPVEHAYTNNVQFIISKNQDITPNFRVKCI